MGGLIGIVVLKNREGIMSNISNTHCYNNKYETVHVLLKFLIRRAAFNNNCWYYSYVTAIVVPESP